MADFEQSLAEYEQTDDRSSLYTTLDCNQE